MQAHNALRFSDVYSAAGQRARLNGGWGHDDFLVHLRVDGLLAERLVLPDTYLLDGAYFLDVKPDDLRTHIGREVTGRRLPILVRTRQNTLAESLRYLLVRSGSPFLNPFPFNAIENEAARNALADLLGSYPIEKYRDRVIESNDVPGALTTLLRELLDEAGFSEDNDLERMHTGWSRWIEVERAPESFRRLNVAVWDRPLDVRSIAKNPIYQIDAEENLATTAGRDLYRETLSQLEYGGTYRADALYRFRESQNSMTSHDEQDDLITIRAWYDHVRHRAIALQHGCTAFAHTQNSLARPIGPLQRRAHDIAGEANANVGEVTVPEDFYCRILNIDAETFAHTMRKIQPEQSVWWRTGDVDSLRRVIDEVLHRASPGGATRAAGLIEVLGRLIESAVPAVGPALGAIVARYASGKVVTDSTRRVVEYLLKAHASKSP